MIKTVFVPGYSDAELEFRMAALGAPAACAAVQSLLLGGLEFLAPLRIATSVDP